MTNLSYEEFKDSVSAKYVAGVLQAKGQSEDNIAKTLSEMFYAYEKMQENSDEVHRYDPTSASLLNALIWDRTPQGFSYWDALFNIVREP